MKTINVWLFILIILVTTGCAPTSRYAWEDYDQKLYDHYKNPAEYDQFVVALKSTIEKGAESDKVPPGIFAEYGFVLYEKGNFEESLIYFKKERDKWPESRILMTKMIDNAKKRPKEKEKTSAPTALPVQTKEVAQ